MRHHTQREWALRHRTSPYIDALQCTALYARLMQAMLRPKHASNLTNVIPHDKFQSCHWPLLAYVALHVLRCVLLEIMLNAGKVVLEGAATRRGGVLSCGDRTPPRRAFGLDRRSTCGSYRIVSYRDILSDIVSYLSFSLKAVSCHHYLLQAQNSSFSHIIFSIVLLPFHLATGLTPLTPAVFRFSRACRL